MKRVVAWIMIGLGAAAFVLFLIEFFGTSDPKGTGSLFFASFILLLVGWMLGDF